MTKNLIFCSAGDNANFYKYWLAPYRNYHLFICYYGDTPNKYKELADHYIMNKGSKFQNLLYVYKNYFDIINQYDYIFVPDDDIIISTKNINKLFVIIKKLNLSIIQPSFSWQGKISHMITTSNSKCILRYTNFIEVNVPLFSKESLFTFLSNYPDDLTCFGVDLYYMWLLGRDKLKYAIIDSVQCINPFENENETREIDKLISPDERMARWLKIKEKYKIENEWEHKNLKLIN